MCPRRERIYQHKGPSQPHAPVPGERDRLKTMLTLAVAHLLQRRLVSQSVLARLYDERETGGNGLGGLRRLGLLGGGHRDEIGRGREGRRAWAAAGVVLAFAAAVPILVVLTDDDSVPALAARERVIRLGGDCGSILFDSGLCRENPVG